MPDLRQSKICERKIANDGHGGESSEHFSDIVQIVVVKQTKSKTIIIKKTHQNWGVCERTKLILLISEGDRTVTRQVDNQAHAYMTTRWRPTKKQ